MTKHGLGYIPDLGDPRDFKYRLTHVARPRSVDLRPKMPSVWDQGQLRDIFIGLIAWCVIVLIGVCAIIASNHQKPIVVANSAGAWDFNAADYPSDDHGRQIRVFATCPWTPWALPKNEGLSKT